MPCCALPMKLNPFFTPGYTFKHQCHLKSLIVLLEQEVSIHLCGAVELPCSTNSLSPVTHSSMDATQSLISAGARVFIKLNLFTPPSPRFR